MEAVMNTQFAVVDCETTEVDEDDWRQDWPAELTCGVDESAVIDAFNALADRLAAELENDRVLADFAAECARLIAIYIFDW
jgi:hypothetical protein